MTSADISPSSTPGAGDATGAIKYATLIPNRVFVGGISANTTEQELRQYFSKHGAVKDTKIISDRTGVSKGYGFVTFETQEDAEKIIKKEGENFIFKERKLNIGHAYRRQQPYPKGYGDAGANGQMLLAAGMPYMLSPSALTYLPDGGYALAAQQAAAATSPQAAATPYQSIAMAAQPTVYQYYQPAASQPCGGYRLVQGATTPGLGGAAGMYQVYQPGSELLYAPAAGAQTAVHAGGAPTYASPQAAATATSEVSGALTSVPGTAVGPGGDPHLLAEAHELSANGTGTATAYVQQQAAASTASPQHATYAQLGGGGIMSTSLPTAHVAYRPY